MWLTGFDIFKRELHTDVAIKTAYQSIQKLNADYQKNFYIDRKIWGCFLLILKRSQYFWPLITNRS